MASFGESASAPSAAAPGFYTWTFPGAPLRIHLHLDVVERLGRVVRRALESSPPQSMEIGGILLGKADVFARPVIEIRDVEPFLCDYRSDHKFILSHHDRPRLEELLAARRSKRPDGLTVVGYYRSHIGEGLSLREADVSAAQAHFCDAANVFLLVKPVNDGSLTAGFFFWDGGRINSEFTFLEFPFEAWQLTGARVKQARQDFATHPADVETPEELPAFGGEAPPPPPSLEWLPAPQRYPARGFHWWWYPLLAVLMIVLGTLGYLAHLKSVSPPAAVPVASDASDLALVVERRGADLLVSWNRHSVAAAGAVAAALAIRDGDLQEQVLRLETEQLRHGSVLYSPASTTVQFRLEVTDPESVKTSETVLALTAAKSDLGTSGPDRWLPAQPAVTPPSPAAESSPATRDFGQRVHVMLVDPPSQAPGAQQAGAEHPLTPTPKYVPPLPIHEVQPSLPPKTQKLVTSLREVDIKVQIDDSGRVVKAEPVQSNREVSGFLVGPARNAAMLWRFVPAQRGDQAVPSELVLRFQYLPAAPR